MSAAQFVQQFKDVDAFFSFMNSFYNDEEKIDELPFAIANEVHGLGYVLACDFLKEIGFSNYGKPDVHVKELLWGLGFCNDETDEIGVQKILRDMARANDVSTFNADKVLWLIGSGKFYLYDLSLWGRGENREDFINWYLAIDEVGRRNSGAAPKYFSKRTGYEPPM